MTIKGHWTYMNLTDAFFEQTFLLSRERKKAPPKRGEGLGYAEGRALPQ